MSKALTKQDVDKVMQDRGYHLHSYSGDGSSFSYIKDFWDRVWISATVYPQKNQIVLQGFPRMFTLTTNEFQFDHPRFKDLFEDKLVAMMFAIAEKVGV